MTDQRTTLRERLADYAHRAWSNWMVYLFAACGRNDDGSVTIPVSLVQRWERQILTPYADLPESEKDSDRTEADRMIGLMDDELTTLRAKLAALEPLAAAAVRHRAAQTSDVPRWAHTGEQVLDAARLYAESVKPDNQPT